MDSTPNAEAEAGPSENALPGVTATPRGEPTTAGPDATTSATAALALPALPSASPSPTSSGRLRIGGVRTRRFEAEESPVAADIVATSASIIGIENDRSELRALVGHVRAGLEGGVEREVAVASLARLEQLVRARLADVEQRLERQLELLTSSDRSSPKEKRIEHRARRTEFYAHGPLAETLGPEPTQTPTPQPSPAAPPPTTTPPHAPSTDTSRERRGRASPSSTRIGVVAPQPAPDPPPALRRRTPPASDPPPALRRRTPPASEGLIRLFRELGPQAPATRTEAPHAAQPDPVALDTPSPEPVGATSTIASTPESRPTATSEPAEPEPEKVVLRIETAASELVAPAPGTSAGSPLAKGPARPVEAPADHAFTSARRGADLVTWIALLLSLSAATALVVANGGLPELFALAQSAGG